MRFTDLFIRRPILSVVVSLLILMVGGSSMLSLPIREYPAMESATIVISTSYPGATQEVMQGFVTTPIAQAVSTASGIEYLTSNSTQGRSEVRAKLVLNADADRSMTEILSKVQQVSYRLPEGVFDPVITKITDGAAAIQYVAFIAEDLPIPVITDFATRVAQPLVTSVSGVASVELGGAQTLAMRIWIDPDQLAARGLSAGDVTNALRNNNIQAAPGRVEDSETVINLTATTDLRDINEFKQMVITSGDSGEVQLQDIATVELGGQNYTSTFASSGQRAVVMAVSPTPDGNPLEIVADIKALIPDMQRVAPPGLTVINQFDVAHFVNASIDEVSKTLIEAVLIVILVIFLFLGSLRAVIIPVLTIPLSLIGTAMLMLVFGFSLNILTLLAMVLAIGLVVDDAIVVVENIHRHIEDGMTPIKAAFVGAREIIGPVIAMTLTLAAVYAPIGMTAGLTGALFKEFAFTLASAVFVSGVVALTLSPMMSSLLLNDRVNDGKFSRFIEHHVAGLANRYDRLLGKTLSNRGAVLVSGVVVLAGIALLFSGVQRELAPAEDHGYIFTEVRAPQYANIDYTSRHTEKVLDIFANLPEFDSSFLNNGAAGQNNAFGGVVLKEWDERERSSAEIQAELNASMSGLTGVSAAIFPPPPLPAGSGGLPVQMVIRSSDSLEVLYDTLERVKNAAWASGLFAFVDSDLAFDSTEARITVDRAKAGDLGISMQEISDTLSLLVGEGLVNRFNWFDRSYDVIAQVPDSKRLTPESLDQYYVRTDTGDLILLSTVIDVEMYPQANSIPQFNQLNAVTVSAVLAPGTTMGQAVEFLAQQPIPPGANIEWLSDSRQYVSEGNRLMVSFVFALIVIFLVLAAQYESVRDPLVILVTVPLAICGALVPLYLGFTTLNIYTQIGLVTLIGLISKHGILMVAFANDIQVQEQVNRITAIRKAAKVRMRPVLMTTAAMVAGMVPLLFATGAGSASRFAIGIVVVMGMLVGTFFTLFILPTVYSFIAKDHRAASQTERALAFTEENSSHA